MPEKRRMTPTEILSYAESALRDRQFVTYYQPQYNHSNGELVGAEGLVRWEHPEYGLQFPSDFIPVFEQNGLITELDKAVFEQVCEFQRGRLVNRQKIVPVSFNVSMEDLRNEEFIQSLEEIRIRWEVPVRFLRVEVTETCIIDNPDQTIAMINRLHSLGYLVEMDDFGSGYSSLNMLKDLPFDIIKLDMNFIRGNIGGRGGIVISSIVHMCRWLNTPLIAEGVETVQVADYMSSIGCDYIQGYLYSRPVRAPEFAARLDEGRISDVGMHIQLIDSLDAARFWNPESLDTLIFNNFVGAAAIINYHNDRCEVLRHNRKYLQEIGMNLSSADVISSDPFVSMDDYNRRVYEDMLERAIRSRDEEECETWRSFRSDCCGEEKLCIRSSVRLLGQSGGHYLFHVMIRNITAERKLLIDTQESELRFRKASEQANIYCWEYTIATREMRPCFRCMRDLGLPPVVHNYPEPLIDSGLFPPDYADIYRDIMRRIDEGVPSLEAVIPLTIGHIPFHVRYTTEFDASGRPVRAFGSATLVIDPDTEKNDSRG